MIHSWILLIKVKMKIIALITCLFSFSLCILGRWNRNLLLHSVDISTGLTHLYTLKMQVLYDNDNAFQETGHQVIFLLLKIAFSFAFS